MVVRTFVASSCRSVVRAYVVGVVPTTPIRKHKSLLLFQSARTYASSSSPLFEASIPSDHFVSEDHPFPKPSTTSSLLRSNPLSLVLLASATSNRMGTGVGVAIVASTTTTLETPAEKDSASTTTDSPPATTRTSFGVYFPEHRSLYEREYTALIVALQWLQQQQHHSPITTIITLPIREDVVYHQMLGRYPIEKESLQTLNKIALNLIRASNLEITLELCPKATPFQECKNSASRALLMEQSDNGFEAFVDPLDPYSSLTSVEDTFVKSEHPLQEDSGVGIELESQDDIDAAWESEAGHAAVPPLERLATAKSEIDPNRTYLLQFDGGARGNPFGPSGCGMVIYDEQRNVVWSGAKYLGVNMTNNQAEYTGIVLGLQHANSLGIRKLRCQGDSLLIIQQLKGHYKVKSEGLKPFHQAAAEAMREFDYFEANHIGRKDNAVADSLANRAMDFKTSFGF
jgi:ribonuclease HI